MDERKTEQCRTDPALLNTINAFIPHSVPVFVTLSFHPFIEIELVNDEHFDFHFYTYNFAWNLGKKMDNNFNFCAKNSVNQSLNTDENAESITVMTKGQ